MAREYALQFFIHVNRYGDRVERNGHVPKTGERMMIYLARSLDNLNRVQNLDRKKHATKRREKKIEIPALLPIHLTVIGIFICSSGAISVANYLLQTINRCP